MRHFHIYRWFAILPILFLFNSVPLSTVEAQSSNPLPLPANTRFSHLTTDDGLAHNRITAVYQDRFGFMWIGTEGGLNMYDGTRFKLFEQSIEDSSMGSNFVVDIIETEEGEIWVATANGGINIFDRLTETFRRFDPHGDGRYDNADISVMTKDANGDFWMGVGADGLLIKFEPKSKRLTEYPLPEFERILNIAIDKQGVVWVAERFALLRIDPAIGLTDIYYPPVPAPEGTGQNVLPPEDDQQGRSRHPLHDVSIDQQGQIWLVAGGQLLQFESQQEEFHAYRIPNATSTIPRKIFIDDFNQIWVGTEEGLYLFDPQSKIYTNWFTHDPVQVDSLSSNAVSQIYEDEGNVIWVGTDRGLNLINRQQAQFSRYQFHPLKENSLAAPSVDEIHVDAEDMIWAITGFTLNQIDPLTGNVQRFNDPETSFARGAPPIAQRYLGIYDDGAGALWLGRWDGMARFDKGTGQFDFYLAPHLVGPERLDEGFFAMAVDNDRIWLWAAQGLYLFDGETAVFEQITTVPLTTAPIINLEVIGNEIWALYGAGGIARYSIATGQLVVYKHERGNANSLLPGPAFDVYLEGDDVWIGTSQGLTRFGLTTERFDHYGGEAGLPNTAVRAILSDQEKGHLWLSTFKGLIRFSPQERNEMRFFEVADGLPSNEFNAGAAFLDNDGQMFFGSQNGLVSFYPDQIRDNPYHPPVVLTEMHIFNEHDDAISFRDFSDKPIYLTDEIVLGPEDELFTLNFAVLSYAVPEKNQYEFWLDEHEENWVTKEENNGGYSVRYSHVEYDDYEFYVKGANNSGVWSENVAELAIIVLPHWYDYPLVQGAGVVAAVIALVGFFFMRTRIIRRQNVVLELQVDERTRELTEQAVQLEIARDNAEAASRSKSTFLSNMSHELRSPLNAILGFAQVMLRSPSLPKEHTDNLNIISRSGGHLLTLINQVLDFSKIEAGRTVLTEVDFDLYRLLEDVENMFRLKTREQNLQLLVELAPDVPQFIRSDEVKLRQVLINLLNNALKFTQEGGVSMRVGRRDLQADQGEQDGDCRLIFEVEDTGVGIAEKEMPQLFEAFVQTEAGRQSQQGTGLGLPISRRFVQLMGGDMSVRSQVGVGSIFQFDIVVQVVETAVSVTPYSSRKVIAIAPNQPICKILIVDDIVTNRQLVISLLRPLGFELREAENGQEAIEMWQQFEPDLIWMDMRMPVLDGYEATQRIKATERGKETVIVALTASSFEGERGVILAAGCDDYLRKPFRDSEMFEMLHQHLGVEFIYDHSLPDEQQIISETVLEKGDLEQIPLNLLAQLAVAIEAIDLDQMDVVLDEIEEVDGETAVKLRHLVQQFEYDRILSLIGEVTK